MAFKWQIRRVVKSIMYTAQLNVSIILGSNITSNNLNLKIWQVFVKSWSSMNLYPLFLFGFRFWQGIKMLLNQFWIFFYSTG